MSKLNKYGIIALMIIISGFSIFLPLYIWPKEVFNEFDAVMFIDEAEAMQTVSVRIDGHMNKRLFGGTRFTGKVKLEGSEMPEEYYTQNIRINFGTDGIGVLVYLDESTENMRLVDKGYICMPLDVSYLVAVITKGEDVKEADATDGIFIVGPSHDKTQVLALVNEKLGKVLDEEIN